MVVLIVLIAATVLAMAWGALALWVQAPGGRRRAGIAVGLWVACACAFVASLFLPGWSTVRVALTVVFLAAVAALALWWRSVRPSNDRNWIPDVAQQTHGEVQGEIVTLQNVRNFNWRSAQDFDVRWETRRYDLSRLRSVDMALSYWSHATIAHTLVSFGFDDGQYVVFSVEIRRKQGDKFSEIGGFFRQYELSIVAADERDILRVRTNMRGEDGYLYRVRMPPAAMRSLFLAYLDEANALVRKPRFYNTITANCTTIVYKMVDRIVPGLPMDYRLLASGLLPEYLYDLGALEGAGSVSEYRRLGRYTDRARANVDLERFSSDIRRGVPGIGPSCHPARQGRWTRL
ncbi:DUF4105 domain-containing protein [Pigmentiphaga sp.]|uniref:Lnb N-terminal periplasmic domain-containing protein n=1 Tax=Pigmentiphaga sp. TaxID=1977564 RepID=UPI0039B8678B